MLLRSWAGSKLRRLTPITTNLHRTFTPQVPMDVPGSSREKRLVESDVPPKLQAELDKGLKQIGEDCIRENAEFLLDMYENICLEHVVGLQVSDRLLRKVLASNPILEKGNPLLADKLTAGSRITRSSLLGQDPFGDQPLVTKKSSDKKSESVDPNSDASDGDSDGEGADTTSTLTEV